MKQRSSSSLCCERSRLLRASEAHLTGGSPGDCVALRIRDGNDGIVEGRLNMNSATFNVLALAAFADSRCRWCAYRYADYDAVLPPHERGD